jgi:hypothetical protein
MDPDAAVDDAAVRQEMFGDALGQLGRAVCQTRSRR